LQGGLNAKRTNEMHDPVFPNGTAICEIEIDRDTYEMTITRYSTVDDVGRCINPLIVHGQTHGGIVQGLGQAVFEQFVISADGQPLCGSFMDYGMPRASDMPSFNAEIAEVLSPTNPLGIKAGGEGGTTPALSVLVSAVCDALKEHGIENMKMPITPQAIWAAIQAHKH
jgi:carbon-monoxide dehydrogenase large subunit